MRTDEKYFWRVHRGRTGIVVILLFSILQLSSVLVVHGSDAEPTGSPIVLFSELLCLENLFTTSKVQALPQFSVYIR